MSADRSVEMNQKNAGSRNEMLTETVIFYGEQE